jgi:phosphatidylglycerophosphatase A
LNRHQLIVWIARGFGSGLSPVAPGTVGSMAGLGWLALLLWPHDSSFFALGAIGGSLLAVWICGRAEQITGQHDPGSVVFDEIIAIPLAFSGWLLVMAARATEFPGPGQFFQGKAIVGTIGVLALFRLFDIWKPWPIRQSQALPGGWGVVADDVLAALYTALLTGFVAFWRG